MGHLDPKDHQAFILNAVENPVVPALHPTTSQPKTPDGLAPDSTSFHTVETFKMGTS